MEFDSDPGAERLTTLSARNTGATLLLATVVAAETGWIAVHAVHVLTGYPEDYLTVRATLSACAEMSNRPITYVYIACPGRSGSTLLSFLLATHPQTSSVGEIVPIKSVDLNRFSCSCGERYVACPFWLSVESRLKTSKYKYSLQTAFRLLHFDVGAFYRAAYYPLPSKMLDRVRDCVFWPYQAFSGEARRIVELSLSLGRAVTDIERTSVFVDAMKDYSRLRLLAKGTRQTPRVHFKAIHLVRDVRGVVSSLLRTGPGVGAARYAHYWARAHNNIQRVRRSYLRDSQYLRVSYSDLCGDPEKELRRISSFLGLESDYTLRDIDPTQFHIVGNKMRLQRISTIRPDNRWRHELSKEDLHTIRHLAGKVSSEYGIDLSRDEDPSRG